MNPQIDKGCDAKVECALKKCEWTYFKKCNKADEFGTSEKIINCKIDISKKLKMLTVLEFDNMLIIEMFIIFRDLNCYE
jgi:hypothetical protein